MTWSIDPADSTPSSPSRRPLSGAAAHRTEGDRKDNYSPPPSRICVRLDRPKEAAAFSADPDSALAEFPEPLLLDEWHVVPEVLGAVKRAVDSDPKPGRFVVTGSVRGDLEAPTWPGTGRLIRTPVFGLTMAEQVGRLEQPLFLDRLAEPANLEAPVDPPDLPDYIDLALRGGFPEPALLLDGHRDRDKGHISATTRRCAPSRLAPRFAG